MAYGYTRLALHPIYLLSSGIQFSVPVHKDVHMFSLVDMPLMLLYYICAIITGLLDAFKEKPDGKITEFPDRRDGPDGEHSHYGPRGPGSTWRANSEADDSVNV